MANEDREPWEQREDETDKAYRGFKQYLDAGPGREKLAAYRQVYDNPEAKQPPGFWSKWAADHDWDERARAWDLAQDRAMRTGILQAQARLGELRLTVALKVQAHAMEIIAAQDPKDATAFDAAKFLDWSSKEIRLLMGESTENVAVHSQHNVTVEFVMSEMAKKPELMRQIRELPDDEAVALLEAEIPGAGKVISLNPEEE